MTDKELLKELKEIKDLLEKQKDIPYIHYPYYPINHPYPYGGWYPYYEPYYPTCPNPFITYTVS